MSANGLSDALFWSALALYGIATVAHLFSLRRANASPEAPGTALTRIAWGLVVAGVAAHLGMVIARTVAVGRVPWGNMYEYSTVMVLLLVAFYTGIARRKASLRVAAAFVLLLATITMGLARGLYTPAGPLQPALNSWWLKVHVISAIAASSIFSIGFVFTVLYLMKDRAERRAMRFGGSTVGAAYAGSVSSGRNGGFPVDHLDADDDERAGPAEGRGLTRHLPAATTLDSWAYRMTAVAFPIWTWAVIAGAIWASKAWSRYWGWDPKETWAFITWVIYAAYLHSRATSGWRGRKAAIVSIAGFVSLWITYYVVNLWIVGLHSYKNG